MFVSRREIADQHADRASTQSVYQNPNDQLRIILSSSARKTLTLAYLAVSG
jgi:hypothetical protein